MAVPEILRYLASAIAVVIVLTLHEFAHALMAVWCGDPTPKWQKRLTLNPARHFDLIGFLAFVLVGFGWSNPVETNPTNFRRYRLGKGLTASAGILMNLLTAFVVCPLMILCTQYYLTQNTYFSLFLFELTGMIYAYSLAFCVFNLLPLFPLDGFFVVEAISKRHGKIYQFLRKYGNVILLCLIVESFICDIFVRYFGVYQMDMLNILGYFMDFATNIVGYPIQALWGLAF